MAKASRDDIPDDLVQWVQPANTRGGLRLVTDPLPAPHTWINTTWLGFDYTRIPGLVIENKLKWQFYHQLDGALDLELQGRRRRAADRRHRRRCDARRRRRPP